MPCCHVYILLHTPKSIDRPMKTNEFGDSLSSIYNISVCGLAFETLDPRFRCKKMVATESSFSLDVDHISTFN